MKVICIDDTHKPNEIPLSNWIKNGELYTVKSISRDLTGKYGLVLEHPVLGEESAPFEFYAARRFVIVEKPLEDQANEVVKDLISG